MSSYLFVCFFFQEVYLAQSCRGISGDIFAYILHTEAYDFAHLRRKLEHQAVFSLDFRKVDTS